MGGKKSSKRRIKASENKSTTEVFCYCSGYPDGVEFRRQLQALLFLPHTPQASHDVGTEDASKVLIKCTKCGPNAPVFASLQIAIDFHDQYHHDLALSRAQAKALGAELETAVKELGECQGPILHSPLGSPLAEPFPTLPSLIPQNFADGMGGFYHCLTRDHFSPFVKEKLMYEYALTHSTMYLQPREMEQAIAVHVLRHGPHGPRGPHQHHGPRALGRLLMYAQNSSTRLKQFFRAKTRYFALRPMNISSEDLLTLHCQVEFLVKACDLCTKQGLLVKPFYCTRRCQNAHWPRHRFFLLHESLPRIFFRIPLAMFDALTEGIGLVVLPDLLKEEMSQLNPTKEHLRLALLNTADYLQPSSGKALPRGAFIVPGVYNLDKARVWMTRFADILGPPFKNIGIKIRGYLEGVEEMGPLFTYVIQAKINQLKYV